MLKEIELQELAPSPSNPRKTFDQVKLQELARSITSVGVLEPLLVRPYPDPNPNTRAMNGHRFEVVAGERRFRAAALANVVAVPCIVRELDDVQVLEIQTIENLQRDDVHPLEEAEGYAALMKQANYDVAQIAERIGRSQKYVYDRVKLLQLIPAVRKVFLDGEISAGHAILLARLNSEDQERAIGDDEDLDRWQPAGLFQAEHVDEDKPGLELDDERPPRKAVSIRELQAWINDHVRFRPEEVDLPNLFPETAAVLATAHEEELKVIKITTDHQLKPDAREESERTYSRPSWKRADGEIDPYEWDNLRPSKTCEHSVIGVIVAGAGRSEAFPVCVAKKKCKVHWAQEIKDAEKRANGSAMGAAAPRANQVDQNKKWEEERRQREAEAARWRKAAPKVMEALAEKLSKTPALKLIDVILPACKGYGPTPRQLERGKTLEEAVRYAAFLVLSKTVLNDYNGPRDAPKVLKPLGIDVKKILDQAAPRPKKEAPPKPTPAKSKTRKKGPGKKSADVVKA